MNFCEHSIKIKLFEASPTIKGLVVDTNYLEKINSDLEEINLSIIIIMKK